MAQIYQQQQGHGQGQHYQPNVHHASQLNTQPTPYPQNQSQSQANNPYNVPYNGNNPNNAPAYHTTSNTTSRNGSMTAPTAGLAGLSHSNSNSNEHLDMNDFPTTGPTTLVRDKSTHRKVPVPDIPDSFPELENMTETQLEKLINDEVARAAHIKTMHMVLSMEEIRDDLKLSNLNEAQLIVEKVCIYVYMCMYI